MIEIKTFILSIVAFSILSISSIHAQKNTTYDKEVFLITSHQPASKWDEGYGVGNGRLGALAFGEFPNETIILNENSIFAKAEIAYPETAKSALREVRMLAAQEKYKEADELFTSDILHHDAKYAQNGSYQQGGILKVDFEPMEKTGYRRHLNMLNGETTTEITFPNGKITATLIAVPEKECIAYRITSTLPQGVSATFELTHPELSARLEDKNTWVLRGQGTNGGTKFENRLVVLSKKGKQQITAQKISVKNAREILILSSTSTDYNIDEPAEPLTYNLSEQNKKILADAQKTSWKKLTAITARHFTEKLERCIINIGNTPEEIKSLATDKRIELVKAGGEDLDLITKLFQFGRYCIIANSRPGGLPCGLQGIWNPDMNAPWRGCYFLNINCQMNHWHTEITNLSEYHQPFLDLVLGLQKGGEEFAEAIGYDGFCYGHNTDLWRRTYFRGSHVEWSASLLNGSWAINHLIEHYRFTEDKAFLEKCIPLLEANTRFMLQWFQPDPVTGELLSGPGTSPETGFYADYNGKPTLSYVSNGNSHDLLVGREAFRNYLFACNELEIDGELMQQASDALAKTPLPKIASDGRLMEWYKEFPEKDKGHRHFSHCYGLFPGNEFDVINTPEYAEAVRKSVDFRVAHGSGHTGWSESWIINLYANLLDGEKVNKHIHKMIANHINPNLFDMHPPFQIDGNFGLAAGVAHCFLQSHIEHQGKRVLQIAPAIPPSWKNGEATGLRARSGATVDVSWDDKTVKAIVTPDKDCEYFVNYKDNMKHYKLSKGKKSIFEFAR